MKPSPAPRPTVARLLPAASALVAAFGLSACGGGDSSTPAPAPAPAPAALSLTGVVAKGAALSGATVSAKCATGTGTATSGTDGSYSLSITGGALPCVLEAVAGTDKLHSAATTTKANITPLTELMVAQLTGQAPATWFTTAASLSDSVTTAKLADAQTAVLTVLTAAGVDTSKAGDFVSGTLVAANGSTTGSDQDKVLDAIAGKLSTAGSTLAQLTETVASSGSATTTASTSALAPELLLKPAAATCSALRATDYWLVITGVTGGDAVQKGRIVLDANKAASFQPYTSADGSTLGSAVSLTANGNCRFTSSQGDDVMVAPSGVIVGTNPQSRAFVAVPVQSHTLAELVGDWNTLASDTADDAVNGIGWTFGYGTVTINAGGYEQFTQGCWFGGLTATTCTALPDAIKARKRPVVVLADGSFTNHSDDTTTADGGPWMDRSFVYRSGQGDYFAVGANVLTPGGGKGDGSVSYATKVRTLALPKVGDTNNNWNVYWNWASGTSVTATDVNTHKIQSVDSTAVSFVRVSGVVGAATHAETLLVNKPFTGFWQRDAASGVATSDGKTTNVRAGIFLKAGSGISVVLQPYQDSSRPARIVVSAAQPS
ncbi:hypothetical protein ACG04R_10335 [Roseateles sp. BYS78W]|uniref:Carboxypeptidase regulatory-like domain-containing protein n=1 Tax=Pelomonas candidula TaxID=3299025 RepID=A0ABW7HC64_9BURK